MTGMGQIKTLLLPSSAALYDRIKDIELMEKLAADKLEAHNQI